jgi:hypothetical protein
MPVGKDEVLAVPLDAVAEEEEDVIVIGLGIIIIVETKIAEDGPIVSIPVVAANNLD